MPFFQTQAPTFQLAPTQTLQLASINPFQVAGQEMTKMSQELDNRAFAQRLRGAKTPEDLLGLAPQTKEQQNMLASALQPITAQRLGEQLDLQRQQFEAQFGTPEQRAMAPQELQAVAQGLSFGLQPTGVEGLQQPAREYTDAEKQALFLTYGSNPAARPALEKILGISQKPSFTEQNADAFVQARMAKWIQDNPNATPEDRARQEVIERNSFYTFGKGELTQQEQVLGLQQLKSKLGSNLSKYNISGKAYKELPQSDKNQIQTVIRQLEGSDSGKLMLGELKSKIGDFNAMQSTATRIGKAAKSDNIKTNVYQSFKDTLQNYVGLSDIQDVEQQSLRSDLLSVGAIMLKLQSGATVTDNERADFFRSLGSLKMQKEVWATGLANKLETSLASIEGVRGMNPDLYDLKFSQNTATMRQAIDELRKVAQSNVGVQPPAQYPIGYRARQGGVVYEFDGTNWNEVKE